ncbi:MAG: hypothetical protein JO285_09935, partial [Kutzneria sp.]|nr:hypothetical protein [Kutzneria sp.]
MIDVEIISVCVGQVSGVGGPVGVVVDGSSAPRHRGEFVAGLPVDEVAFVEDAANGTLSVVDSTGE